MHRHSSLLCVTASTLLLLASADSAFAVKQKLVFISDTQYPWTEKSDTNAYEDEHVRNRRSQAFIRDQGNATKAFRMANGGIDKVPLFLNGDITAFGHGNEIGFMRDAVFKDQYVSNFYLNLGNHDYQNNVGRCGNNGCARDMVHFERGAVSRYPYRYFDDNKHVNGGISWTTYTGSLAYSMQFGSLLAIQLQNEPTYTTKIEGWSGRSTINITSSMDLLEKELKWARLAGKDVILNMHKAPFDHWQSPNDARFLKLMKDNEDLILGIFGGHLHSLIGARRMLGKIPVYLSGASHYGTWLTAEHDSATRSLTVWKVEGNDWRGKRTQVGMHRSTAPRAAAIPDSTDYPRHGWGTWGPVAMCPRGQFVTTMQVRGEAPQGNGDDTALNAVRFYCSGGSTLRSREGQWGTWDSKKQCSGKGMTGVQMRIERNQGEGSKQDDTGMNNLRFRCADGSTREGANQREWGTWQAPYRCPAGMSVAGFQTKVEDPQGKGDDTALNRIQLFCRPV